MKTKLSKEQSESNKLVSIIIEATSRKQYKLGYIQTTIAQKYNKNVIYHRVETTEHKHIYSEEIGQSETIPISLPEIHKKFIPTGLEYFKEHLDAEPFRLLLLMTGNNLSHNFYN